MNILLIDNTMDPDCWGSQDIVRFLVGPQVTVHVRRAPHDDLPVDAAAFDKLILSGSRTSCRFEAPWVSHLDAFVKSFLTLTRPFLGICYGHQTLCRVLGGTAALRRGTTPEFGWTEIHQTSESSLLKGLPGRFHSFSSHFEEAHLLPGGTVKIAESSRCGIQGIQLIGKSVFGIQFHPEKLETEGNKSIATSKKEGIKDGLLGEGKSKRLYDTQVGQTIFNNFLEMK